MVKVGASGAHEDDIEKGYIQTLAAYVIEGDLLKMNCVPDALVLNVVISPMQIILDIRHADGDDSSLSRRPDEKVKIRER